MNIALGIQCRLLSAETVSYSRLHTLQQHRYGLNGGYDVQRGASDQPRAAFFGRLWVLLASSCLASVASKWFDDWLTPCHCTLFPRSAVQLPLPLLRDLYLSFSNILRTDRGAA